MGFIRAARTTALITLALIAQAMAQTTGPQLSIGQIGRAHV